jgi:hypothetical protein
MSSHTSSKINVILDSINQNQSNINPNENDEKKLYIELSQFSPFIDRFGRILTGK